MDFLQAEQSGASDKNRTPPKEKAFRVLHADSLALALHTRKSCIISFFQLNGRHYFPPKR
jgi:hypothetical protein